jgi:ribose transport system substrate-binding protein
VSVRRRPGGDAGRRILSADVGSERVRVTKKGACVTVVGAVAVLAIGVTSVGATQERAATKKASYVIGVSNGLVGNGWREEMICAVKAQSLASHQVSKVIVWDKNADAAAQQQGLRDLISQHVNAIVVNPQDRNALNPAIKLAAARGIKVVAVDQAVSAPEAYVASNDQVKYGFLGGQWLAKKIGGKGSVLYMRGLAGFPADSDRDKGFRQAMKAYPGIKLKQVFTGWDFTKGAEAAAQQIASGAHYDGIWTSGIDYTVVNAYKKAGLKPPPLVGADDNEFIHQLLTKQDDGAAVTNPAVIGGVGTKIAIDLLNGKKVAHTTLLTPRLWSMPKDKATLTKNYFPKRPPTFSAAVTIPGYTSYTPAQLFACKGP